MTGNMITTEKSLQFSRTFYTSAAELWGALTEPHEVRKWWGPEFFTCPFCSIDLRVGGKYLTCMRSMDGAEFWSTGVYKEIVPYQKLVYTDSFSDKDGNIIPASAYQMPGEWPDELLITLYFEEKNGQTIMNLVHEGLPQEIHEECMKSWNQSFDKLDDVFK